MGDNKWYDPSEREKLLVDQEAGAQAAAAVTTAKTVFDNGNSGASKTLSVANGKYQKLTLSASAPTLTVSGFTAGQYDEIILFLKQDATGSRLLPTFSPAADYGTPGAPTLTTTVNKTDKIRLSSIDGGTTLHVEVITKGL